MKYTFILNKMDFKKYPKLLWDLDNFLKGNPTISSTNNYNKMIKQIISILKKEKISVKNTLFEKEIKSQKTKSPLIEKTPWGLVSIKKVDTQKDFIQKLLVVKQHGILGFEIHNKKLEKLHVLEGLCLIISSQHKLSAWKSGVVTIELGYPGKKVTFQPKDEHGIITWTSCVIEETSNNNLNDLVYIYPSKQIN